MSTKRALFALSLALFVVLPTFGSRNEILRADDGEEDNPDCEFTEAMFNAIREKLSCPTVKACSKCNLCCENSKDHNTSRIFPKNLQLMCHSHDQITVEWTKIENVSNVVYLTKLYKDSKYIPNYHITKSNYSSFYDLESATEYSVCIWAFDKLGQIGEKVCNHSVTYETNFISAIVDQAWVEDIVLTFDNKTSAIETVLKWKPSKDKVCTYNILALRRGIFYTEKQVDVPEELSTKFSDLDYDTDYSVVIRGIINDSEGQPHALKFHVPTCFAYHKSLDQCPPSFPTNIEVVEEISKIQPDKFNKNYIFYNVNVTWTPPEPKPAYYIVNITNTNNRLLLETQRVNGNETGVIVKNVPLSKYYKVSMAAGSKGGISVASRVDCEIEYSEKDSSLWTVIAPVFGFIIVFCLLIFIYRRNEKIKLTNRRRQYFEDLEQKAPKEAGGGSNFTICPDDPYEIISEKVIMFEILGEGAFGIVRKGWIPEHNKEVAVKMLKDDPSAEEVKQFRQEIDMMKAVGSHAHIVSLVGCCTCPSSTMMLIVEYCTLGDLQNYLRAAWDKISSKESSKLSNSENTNSSNDIENCSGQIKYAELLDSENNDSNKISNFIINKTYDLEQNVEEAKKDEESDISPADLLSFARQIAMGMEYLSSSRVIHRDLAARNVLVCANKTVKIADFGLSRDIYQENIYRKRSSGKLPIKWMAIESLTHQMYTTQSDVWSYGVLLWEIVTLGSTPYPSIPTGKLLKLLLSGYRMECPINCSLDIYDIMNLCWRTRAKDRPSFTEIRQKIDLLLEGICSNSYLSLEILENVEKPNIKKYSSNDLLSNNIDNSQNNCEKSDSEGYVRPITITKNNLSPNVQLQHNNKPVFIPNNKQVQANNGVVNNFNLLSNRISYSISDKNIDEKLFCCKENDDFKNIKSNYKTDNHSMNYLNGNGNYYASQNVVLSTKLN